MAVHAVCHCHDKKSSPCPANWTKYSTEVQIEIKQVCEIHIAINSSDEKRGSTNTVPSPHLSLDREIRHLGPELESRQLQRHGLK